MGIREKNGMLAVAAAAVLWSSGGLFIKLAPMPAATVACARGLVSALFFLIVLRPDLRKARWTSALSYAGTCTTFVIATKLGSAANAAFLQYTGPAYVLVLAPLLLGERFRRADAVAVGLSLAGMSLVFAGRGVGSGGIAAALTGVASGVCYAFTVVLFRRDAKTGGDVIASTTLGALIAAAVMAPSAVSGGVGALLTAKGALIAMVLGVQMGVSYVCFARGVRTTPAATASMITTLEPVLNPVWVWIGTGEAPGMWTVAGGAIVVAAVIVRAATVAGPVRVAEPVRVSGSVSASG